MRRREFITLIGSTMAAWPILARAQQPLMPVIGFLNSSSRELFAARVAAFAALALRQAMPAIYQTREFAAAGGLMSYGGNLRDAYRRLASILGGFSRPKSQPICRSCSPRKSRLIINLKTANALGVHIPLSVLASADEVIE
jgi:putative ABC transport system substrate-binding protein